MPDVRGGSAEGNVHGLKEAGHYKSRNVVRMGFRIHKAQGTVHLARRATGLSGT